MTEMTTAPRGCGRTWLTPDVSAGGCCVKKCQYPLDRPHFPEQILPGRVGGLFAGPHFAATQLEAGRRLRGHRWRPMTLFCREILAAGMRLRGHHWKLTAPFCRQLPAAG